MPSTYSGCADAADFEDGRHDVNDVMELVADAAEVLDVAGPGDAHALPRAAEVRGDLLGPAERRVEGPRPRHGHVVVGLVRAPGVVEVLQLVLDRELDAVELATSFGVPISVPSALEPLSPLM